MYCAASKPNHALSTIPQWPIPPLIFGKGSCSFPWLSGQSQRLAPRLYGRGAFETKTPILENFREDSGSKEPDANRAINFLQSPYPSNKSKAVRGESPMKPSICIDLQMNLLLNWYTNIQLSWLNFHGLSEGQTLCKLSWLHLIESESSGLSGHVLPCSAAKAKCGRKWHDTRIKGTTKAQKNTGSTSLVAYDP
jgi:hypothetical protein